MNEKEKVNQITEGVIWKQLLLFFFPIVFGTFFQQIYNTADTIVVGRFVGKQALAAVGIVGIPSQPCSIRRPYNSQSVNHCQQDMFSI